MKTRLVALAALTLTIAGFATNTTLAQDPNAAMTALMSSLGEESASASSPFGSAFGGKPEDEKYPKFFWNYGTFRAYERMEKRLIRSRVEREIASNNLERFQYLQQLKAANRESRKFKIPKMQPGQVLDLGVSPSPRGSDLGLSTQLHRPQDPLQWPQVLLYTGFADDRTRVDELLAIPTLDQQGLRLVARLLDRMEQRLRDYRGSNVVVTPRDIMQGVTFIRKTQRLLAQPPQNESVGGVDTTPAP